MSTWVKVYDLAHDIETIELVQQATANTEDFGLVPEIALFGSDEWWNSISDGRIPTYEVSGIISRVFMSGHGDWPEFEVDSGDEKTVWARLGEKQLYQVGREVKVNYVIQKARKHWLVSPEQKVVLRIHIRTS